NFTAGIYASVIPAIQQHFSISQDLSISGLSFFACGVAFGPVLAAPISEIYGRRYIYLLSSPITIICLAGTGAARNFQTVAVLRFFTGLSGSPAMAVGGGTIADLWDISTEPLGSLMLLLMVVFTFVGAELGPAAGGYLVDNRGWRWAFWVPMMLNGCVWLFSLGVRETYRDLLLQKKSHGRVGTQSSPSRRFLSVLGITFSRAVYMLLTEPILLLVSLYGAFALGVFYLFYVAYPYILSRVYSFGLKDIGLAYISLAVGSLLAIPAAIAIDKTLYQRARAKTPDGRPPPEARMYGAMVPSGLLPFSLLWLAWSSHRGVPWISTVLSAALFGLCQVLLFTYYSAYMVDIYRDKAGASALAGNGLLRYGDINGVYR
ncbi:uncharacterized protein A1O5_10851, partial [Cladophialophora psammophila CBS 110553]